MEFIFIIFLSFGIYLVACDLCRIPTLAAAKAVMSITQPKKRRVFSLEAIEMSLASRFSKIIRLSDSRKKEWKSTLTVAEIPMQPETYFARCIVKTLMKLLLLIPFSLLAPLMDLIIIIWAVWGVFNDISEAQKKVKQRHEEINQELPRFVSTVEQELNSTGNILAILDGYKGSAGQAFRYELEIAIAEMKTGSQEQALIHLESRVNTVMMSQTVRGLLAVMRGDNGVMHFAMLANDFKQQELQQLKMIAQKRPDKVKVFNYLILAGFFITFLTPIAIYLVSLIKQMM